jgi:hypothetical protein
MTSYPNKHPLPLTTTEIIPQPTHNYHTDKSFISPTDKSFAWTKPPYKTDTDFHLAALGILALDALLTALASFFLDGHPRTLAA